MFDVRVATRHVAAEDIVALELVPLASELLPAFEAGSHIDIQVAPGVVRQYSLHNDPRERHRYCIGVLKDPSSRGGSQAVHRDLQVGSVVAISEPRNNFKLDEEASETILLAGGIGITPLLSMAEGLKAKGRKFSLHYCARSQSRAAFVDRIRDSHLGDHASFYFDDSVSASKLSLAKLLHDKGDCAHVYICGPAGFIQAMKEGALALGIAPDRVHIEHFNAEVSTAGDTFTVVAKRSGVEVQVGESQTIAQALAARGIPIALSCEQGVCGTCLTPVLEGIPDHRDMFQSDDERAANDMITICCSRACSGRLVLDI